jgi:hypothetical protein
VHLFFKESDKWWVDDQSRIDSDLYFYVWYGLCMEVRIFNNVFLLFMNDCGDDTSQQWIILPSVTYTVHAMNDLK